MQELIDVVLKVTGGSAFGATLSSLAGQSSALGGALGGLTSMVFGLQGAIASLAGGALVSQMTSISSEFENTQNRLAGSLTALGQASDFNDGLMLARDTMRQITLDAAKLPGEAEEYVQVFTGALPVLQEAIGGSLQDMTKFSNQLTAIGKTLGIDAGQITRDTQLMLRAGPGGAGLDVRTFTSLLPFMKQVENQANLTRESFNKMTQPQRAKLLQDTFAKLQPMLDNASNSWEAMTGAMTSTTKEIIRLTGAPLFEAMKTGLGSVIGMVMDANGKFTEFGDRIIYVGQFLSTTFVEGAKLLVDTLKDFAAPVLEGLSGAGGGIEGMLEQAFGGIDLDAIVQRLTWTFDNVVGVVQSLSGVISPLVELIGLWEGALFNAYSEALPGFTDALAMVIDPLAEFAATVFGIIGELVDFVSPYVSTLASVFGELASAIGEIIGPALQVFGGVLGEVFRMVIDFVKPAFVWFIENFTEGVRGIIELLKSLGASVKEGYGYMGLDIQTRKPRPEASNSIADFFKGVAERLAARRAKDQEEAVVKAAGKRTTTHHAAAGAKVVQDFRNSRFTIEQQFKEGFDPDRIAAVFARDVGRAGQQRLQSGFEPLFAVR